MRLLSLPAEEHWSATSDSWLECLKDTNLEQRNLSFREHFQTFFKNDVRLEFFVLWTLLWNVLIEVYLEMQGMLPRSWEYCKLFHTIPPLPHKSSTMAGNTQTTTAWRADTFVPRIVGVISIMVCSLHGIWRKQKSLFSVDKVQLTTNIFPELFTWWPL